MNQISCYVAKPFSRATENECKYKKLRSVDLSRAKVQNGVYKLSYGQYATEGYISYLAVRD